MMWAGSPLSGQYQLWAGRPGCCEKAAAKPREAIQEAALLHGLCLRSCLRFLFRLPWIRLQAAINPFLPKLQKAKLRHEDYANLGWNGMNSKVENLCCQNSQQNQRASAEQWIQSEVDGEDTRLQRP